MEKEKQLLELQNKMKMKGKITVLLSPKGLNLNSEFPLILGMHINETMQVNISIAPPLSPTELPLYCIPISFQVMPNLYFFISTAPDRQQERIISGRCGEPTAAHWQHAAWVAQILE